MAAGVIDRLWDMNDLFDAVTEHSAQVRAKARPTDSAAHRSAQPRKVSGLPPNAESPTCQFHVRREHSHVGFVVRATHDDYDFDRWLGHPRPDRMHLGPRDEATVYADKQEAQSALEALARLLSEFMRLTIEEE